MKLYDKHHQASAGEWIPHKRKMEWQCCDCGLVHDVYFKLGVGKRFIWVKMYRNSKATKIARLKK